MPMQQAPKSGLMAKYGARLDKAVKAHAADPVVFGTNRVRAGINGIARLTKCRFEQYKAGSNMKRADSKSAVGEYYFTATAVVVEPASDAGAQTSIMEPVCDTKSSKGIVTSQEEHIHGKPDKNGNIRGGILNELKKLWGEGFPADATGADLESIAAQLEEAKPHFRFSTSVREPMEKGGTPGVWENWNGVRGCENYQPEHSNGQVVDNSGGQAQEPEPQAEPEPQQEPAADEVDLDALAETATPKNAEGRQLNQIALDAGIEQDAIDAADSYADVVALIRAAQGEGEGETGGGEEVSPAAPDPAKGDECVYQPIGKDGKPLKNSKGKPVAKVNCEVQSVNNKAETAVLKNLDDGKTLYKDVPWASVEPAA